MRNVIVKLSMCLMVLAMSANMAWANMDIDFNSLDPEIQAMLTASSVYSAKLTGRPSSTGGGKVYVNTSANDPRSDAYEEGVSNEATNSWALSLPGMDVSKVYINAWAKPDAGYRLQGWSFSNGGVDLGMGETDDFDVPVGEYVQKYDVATVANETVEYVIYATFEPLRFTDYSISGTNTTAGGVCTQTIELVLDHDDISAADFAAPTITSSKGGGNWSSADGDPWTVADLSVQDEKVQLTVLFTAPDASAAEYSANLRLQTVAGIAMNVPLNARTVATGVQAIRYSKTKEQEDQGALSAMLAGASEEDIIRLNGDYAEAVTINKNVTFDLNGYTLNGALDIAGDVTLAYSPYGGTVTGDVTVATGHKLVLNGGQIDGTVTNNGTLEQNGATINGNITNNGDMTTTDGVHYGTLSSNAALTVNGGTFTTSNAVAVMVNSGSATIRKGTIFGAGYGLQTGATAHTTIEKLAVIDGGTKALNCIAGGTLTVNCGKFADPNKLNAGTIEFHSAYFHTNNNELEQVEGKSLWRNTSGAEYKENYVFFAGDLAAAQAAGVSVCHIAGTSYSSLEAALAYANNTDTKVTIVMDNDYALPAGYYTLPSNATLIIPMDNEQNAEYKVVNRESGINDSQWLKPSCFRKLTLLNGVNIDVHGTIEVSGSQYSTNKSYTGAAYGPYGQIQMNPGSKMVLQNNSELRAWGFITGDIEHMVNDSVLSGEIDARRGSMVRELFQMGDWKGATFSAAGLVQGDSVFPINTYFIQNIEAPVKYHPGSKLSTTTTVHENLMGIVMSANDILIIGVTMQDVAMFLMDANADQENTWVRKYYDAKHDKQVYEINSGAHVGQLVISLMSSPLLPLLGNFDEGIGNVINNMTDGAGLPENLVMNSGQYFLPITNNFKMHLLSGELSFTQSTALLPGSELEIDKEAMVSIEGRRSGVKSGSLFVYDWRDWGNYAGGVPGRVAKYSPVFNGAPNRRDVSSLEALGSACLNVHGSFVTKGGYVMTTGHGANIYSSVEDAGTFVFSYPTQEEGYTEEIKQYNGGYYSITCYPIWLRNNNNPRPSSELSDEANQADYVQTAGKIAYGGESFCYLDIDGTGGKWTKLQQRECFTYDAGSETYYIKPQEYVAVTVDADWDSDDEEFISVEGNEDHTFSDAAGAGRLFINLGSNGTDCQWWEVEQKDNLYHCIHPLNDTYYEWNQAESKWQEVRFTITWQNWDGTELTTYKVPYGTMAEWLSSNPTREADVDYTYDFIDWTPALDKVTSDVTYTATYEKKQIQYTVVFEQDGGVEIERHLLARNEMPVCENTPTRTGYILQWEPALAAVTGNAVYKATWLPEPLPEYEIKFMDYDGTTPLQVGNVAVGSMPTPPADPSGKQPTDEFTYVFDHWTPEPVAVTQAMTYTAVYREEARQYAIRYYNESGADVQSTQYLPYGAIPTPPAVEKTNPETGHTYTLVWKTLDESATIAAVTGDASYKPTYLDVKNKYVVTLKCNPSGAATLTGAGLYEYGDAISIAKSDNDDYTFINWTDADGNAVTSLPATVQDNITLTANYTYSGAGATYTITWKNGATVLKEVVQEEGTATTYLGETPTREDALFVYTFDGWAVTPDGEKAYKDGMTPRATGNATYYAHFTTQPRTYTVTWKSEDGAAVLEQDAELAYGDAVAYNGIAPTKVETVEATYVFDGWSASVGGALISLPATVSEDVTYYAHFTAIPQTYTITWLDENGGQIDQTNVAYGVVPTHDDATKTSTAEFTYTFAGWTPEVVAVSGDATYQATFSATTNTYIITWLDENGGQIDQTNVAYGVVPTHDDASKASTAEYTYTFTGWTPEVVAVSGDATYQATFSATTNTYTITWLDENGGLIDQTNVAYGVVPTHDDPSKASTAEFTYTFAGWSPEVVAVSGNATYQATFSATTNTYTITWKSEDGTSVLELDADQPYGAATLFNGAAPEKEATAQYTYTFDGWATEANGDKVYDDGATPTVSEDAIYYAHFDATPVAQDLLISADDADVIELTAATACYDLILASDGEHSGQLVGGEYLNVTGNAYFDLTLNAQSHVWYAVAVPWQVDAETGISVNGNALTLGTDFDLLYYNGNLRASQGVNMAWNYVENDADKTMQPGRLYMIGLMMDAPVVRFTKKNGASVLTTSTTVTEYPSAVASDANWNGIANPALFHAYLNAGTEEGQIYDADAVGYHLITLNNHKLVVGQPVFVQAPSAKSVVVTYGGPFAAPHHTNTTMNTKYEVLIASAEAASTDRLFVKTNEDKAEDAYVIGQDLAKMGVSSKVAQVWVNRYNTKLCVNTQAPVNGVAEYPLGIYAPVAGEYTISCQPSALSEQEALYLTYDGQVVWNLTQSAYTLNLNAGTDTHYGLRVVGQSSDTTGMDEIIVDAQGETRKVIVNDHVLIIRGDRVYTIDGQMVY